MFRALVGAAVIVLMVVILGWLPTAAKTLHQEAADATQAVQQIVAQAGGPAAVQKALATRHTYSVGGVRVADDPSLTADEKLQLEADAGPDAREAPCSVAGHRDIAEMNKIFEQIQGSPLTICAIPGSR